MSENNSKPDNPPAFARPYGEYNTNSPGKFSNEQEGMTLRDYFAAKAMQSLIQVYNTDVDESDYLRTQVSVNSYKMADEMLKAREL